MNLHNGASLLLVLTIAYGYLDAIPADTKNAIPGEELVTIITAAGEIVGRRVKVPVSKVIINDNLYLYQFYGIPFAEPPVGKLRFKAPVKISPWAGKQLALNWGSSCVQYIPVIFNITLPNMSEDCLYLNVWVPDPVPQGAAVMVYIHGGGFSGGSSVLYDFTSFVATQNVIVISMNYRVSSLGFLAFGTEDCPGNMGLMDQDLALKWVNENIDRFGGDPDRVTLFGQSAGSVSTGHNLLNPHSAKLFRRAILQSGSPLGSWGRDSVDQGKRKSMKLADAVGCSNTSKTEVIIDCLMKVESSILVKQSANFGNISTMYHFPVVDNKYVFDVNLALESIREKDVMMGVTSHDGAVFVYILASIGQTITENLFERFVSMYAGPATTNVLRSAGYYYKDHCNELSKFKEEITTTRAATDFLFGCVTKKLAVILANAGVKTYFYQFTHRELSLELPSWVEADHGAELSFLLGTSNFEGPELELSQRMMTYWASFAKHGDPNEENQAHNKNFHIDRAVDAQKVLDPWKRYSLPEKTRNDIGLYSSRSTQGDIRKDQCDYWEFDFPNIREASLLK